MAFAIVRKTTKQIEDGHRGLQDCYYFYVFTFFKSKKSWLFTFLPCFVRFLELWITPLNHTLAYVIRTSPPSPNTDVATPLATPNYCS